MSKTSALSPTIIGLAFCQAMMMSGASLMVTVSALVGDTLAADPSYATLPIFAQFVSMMLSTVPASLLMARFGRKPAFLMAACAGICAGGLAFYAIATHWFIGFVAASAMLGMASGFGNYFRFAAAEISSEDKRSRAIAYVLAGGIIAAFIGPNIAYWSRGIVPNEPYAGGFLFLMGFYVIMMLILLLLRLPKIAIDAESKAAARPLLVIIRQPGFRVAVICAMFGYAIMNFVMTATPLEMDVQCPGLDNTAFVIQWHVLAMFAPSFITGNLIDRFGIISVLAVGAVCNAICVIINLLGDSVWHFWLALIFLGVGWNFLFIGGTRLLTETYTDAEKGKTQACNDFMVFTMVSFSALSAGYVHHHYGWFLINIAVLPIILLVIEAIAWFDRRDGKMMVKSSH